MSSLTLEQLTAVCDEIAAISRAGLPLDRGLQDASAELPGAMSRLTAELGKRLEAGEPLNDVLLSRTDVFPPAFRAVLEAGVRSGNLPQAVEAVSRSARTMADLRNTVRIAWIYPYFLIATAYLVLWIMLQTLPILWDFFHLIDMPLNSWEETGRWIAGRSSYWFPLLGVVLFLWIVWDLWSMSRRGALFSRSWDTRLMGSGWQTARRLSQQATFCELTSLLIEHNVPLVPALRLAAEGSDPDALSALEETCQAIEKGSLNAIEQSPLPPMIRCVLLAGGARELLAKRLRRLADYFRREAASKVAWGAMRLPMLVALGVGGILVISFAAIFWLPWLRVLQRMTEANF